MRVLVLLVTAVVMLAQGADPLRQATAYIQKMRETADPSWLDRATKLIDSALAADPKNYGALRLRSEIELERHNFKQVVVFSKELIAVGPGDPWNYGTLGDALMELGDYEAAADAYQKMVTLRPDLASYNRAAYYRFIAGDLPGAIALMQRAVAAGSRQPENMAWCQAELGQLLLKAKRYREAEDSYRAALLSFPNYHPALAGLGKTLAAQGKPGEAIPLLLKAQATVPWPDYAATLRELYAKTGQAKAAQQQAENLDVLERLGRAQGETANRGLALALADAKRNLPRARELAEGELKVRGDVYSWDALAWVLFTQGEPVAAAEAMGQALRMKTPEPLFAEHAAAIGGAMLDAKLNATQRNTICHQLRSHVPVAVLEAGLADPKLSRCAALALPAASFAKALTAEDSTLRALAARELGRLALPEYLSAIAPLVRDASLLVSTSAMEGLSHYQGLAVEAVYAAMLQQADGTGIMALQRLAPLRHPAALPAARRFLAQPDVGGRLAALSVLADLGEAADLPALREVAKEHEEFTAGGRGFGLMPSISLGKAAKTAMAKLEARTAASLQTSPAADRGPSRR